MATPARTRVTYEDLRESLPEGSLFTLIDGDLFMSPAPDLLHQAIVGNIYSAIRRAITDASRVYVSPVDVAFSKDDAAQPDIVFVTEKNRSILQDYVRGAPDLVVEVLSPSTARRDKSAKKAMYERYGVGEFWIVSPENQSVEIYRIDPVTRAYRLVSTLRAGDVVTTPLIPALAVDVAELFAE